MSKCPIIGGSISLTISITCLHFTSLSVIYFIFAFLVAPETVTWPSICSIFCTYHPSLCYISLELVPSIWPSFYILRFYLSYFSFRNIAHDNCTDLNVEGYIISHISSAWYRYSNTSSFQYWVSWNLLYTKMDSTVVEDVWSHCRWISWEPWFLPSQMWFYRTIKLTDFPAQQCPVPYCWVSFCSCFTFHNDIWVSWCTPSTPERCWPYLLPFLWIFGRTHAHNRSLPPGIASFSKGVNDGRF